MGPPQDRGPENGQFTALLMCKKEHWECESLHAGLLCAAHELLWVCPEERISKGLISLQEDQ